MSSDPRTCRLCGKELTRQQVYCSSRCSWSAPRSDKFYAAVRNPRPRGQIVRLPCETCETLLKGQQKRYCSKQCLYDAPKSPRFYEAMKERGQVWTEQHKKDHSERMRGRGNSMFGKKHTAEVRATISSKKQKRDREGPVGSATRTATRTSKAENDIGAYLESCGHVVRRHWASLLL